MKRLISTIVAAAIAFASLSCTMISADAATIRGDVNGDNHITLRDATLAQKINVGSKTPSKNEKYSADFDASGTVELSDALLIQKFVCLDKTTLDTYAPNRSQRIAFLNLLNADREAEGLSPIEYNDAMLDAGTIRAREYIERGDNYRADGSQFYTIFAECNLNVNTAGSLEKTGHDVSNGTRLYNIYKSANSPVFQYMMSSDCTVVCIGSILDSTSSSMATWVIDVA